MLIGGVLLLNPPPQGCYQSRDILFGDTPPVDVVEFSVNVPRLRRLIAPCVRLLDIRPGR